MFPDMVSVKDYAGMGMSSFEDLNNLRKALDPGYAITGQTGGATLRVQSLEGSMKILTFRSEHIKLFKKLPKGPAFSTNEEFNQLLSYGNTRNGFFVRSGELPGSSDSQYVRRNALVKYCGTTREVTHPMTLVNPAHGDVIALYTHDAIMHILGMTEYYMFYGDSSLAYSGESEQWDGLDTLIDSESFIDLEGRPLQESDIQDAANLILTDYGYPTDLFLGFKAHADFVKTFYSRLRMQMPAPIDGRVGLSVTSMITSAGEILMNPDVFLRKGESPVTQAAVNSPLPPALVQNVTFLGNNTADWQKLLGIPPAPQTFSYAVSCCNRYGESAPRYMTTPFAVLPVAQITNQQALCLDVVLEATLGSNLPEYLKVYRTEPGVTAASPENFSLIMQIPVTSQTGGATMSQVVIDRNFILPFTSRGYMLQLDETVLKYLQLAPLMKMDLAVIGPAYRFMALLYGVLAMYVPKRGCKLLNVGDMT